MNLLLDLDSVPAPPTPLYRILGPFAAGEEVSSEGEHTFPTYEVDVYRHERPTRERIQILALVKTKESALAVLRLHGATEYHDWTVEGANWDMPLVPVDSNAGLY